MRSEQMTFPIRVIVNTRLSSSEQRYEKRTGWLVAFVPTSLTLPDTGHTIEVNCVVMLDGDNRFRTVRSADITTVF